MAIKGIDVSEHQGKINWDKVKASGIKYAILRCGFGMDIESQDDSYFSRNAKECERLGIPYGVYLFSYANTIEKAKSEAEHTLRLIKNKKITLGIWYDIEDNNTSGKVSKDMLENIIRTYCERIKEKGYRVGIYANLNWLKTKINASVQEEIPVWVAQYYSKCEYKKKYTMWQYSSSGKVDGISGNVDMNYLYDETLLETTTNSNISKETEKDRIKALQTALNKDFKCGLAVDGIIGPATTKAVMENHLKYFTRGNFVKWTQTQLKRKGYTLGSFGIDGGYGKDTESAVWKYQKDKQLTIDGCVGIEVAKSLVE